MYLWTYTICLKPTYLGPPHNYMPVHGTLLEVGDWYITKEEAKEKLEEKLQETLWEKEKKFLMGEINYILLSTWKEPTAEDRAQLAAAIGALGDRLEKDDGAS